MPKKKKADHQTLKSDAVELNEEELDQAQGGGIPSVTDIRSMGQGGGSGKVFVTPRTLQKPGKEIPDLDW